MKITTMTPQLTGLDLRPELSREDLCTFVERMRPELPDELWRLVEPYTETPRNWSTNTEVYGFATVDDGDGRPWRCELHAPIPWHDVVDTAPSLRWADERPTVEQLRGAWTALENLGARPAFAANLGPSESGDAWLVQVVLLSTIGSICVEEAREVGRLFGGRVGGIADHWACWRTGR
ncbi:hypothetical protein [Nocardia callitridis]|uniref:Uncharacterized protein n=1 Tax=Nocardia callitridis TaxID=648753 RepID=A0ABP9KJJ6_9NOCA